jgi:mannosyltransferase OCH1-like enzyme
MVWDEAKLQGFQLRFPKFYSRLRIKQYNQRSDLLRLEILFKYGGVYVDSDILSINRIPEVLLQHEFFSVVEKKGLVSNAFVGAVRGYQLLPDLLRKMEKEWVPQLPVWKTTGPKFVTEFLLRKNIIRPCGDHGRTYNFMSTHPGVHILPYYSINYMKDSIRGCTFSTMQTTACKPNKDVHHDRCVQWSDIFGLHLWFGGKPTEYANEIDPSLIRNNLKHYIQFVKETKK